jgi:hypothetical protein
MLSVKSPRDFCSGLLYIAIGGGALFIALRDYTIGTAAHMGPGYFPAFLSSLLIIFGILSVVRALAITGPAMERFAWRQLAIIVGAVVLFAFLIERLGLVLTLPIFVIVCATASSKFRFEWRAALGVVGLTVFCVLVFVEALRMQLPLFGPWVRHVISG